LLLDLLRSLLSLIGILLCLIGEPLNLLLRLGSNSLGVAYDLLLSLDRSGHSAADGTLHCSSNIGHLRATDRRRT
jgi:hypothetical protein